MVEKRIKDLMTAVDAVPRISPLSKVAKAVSILERNRSNDCPAFLLVVDEGKSEEKVLGTISCGNILREIGKAAEGADEIPIFWQGQFVEQVGIVMEKSVEEVMTPIAYVLSSSGTLMEALHLMIANQADLMVAVKNGDVVGILTMADLFKEVHKACRGKDV